MRKTAATKTDEAVNTEDIINDTIEEKELDLDKLITLRSIANWTTGFARKVTSGDVSIAPRGMIRLSRSEVIAQAQTPNKLITGDDGMGNHPTLIIEDDATKNYLGYNNTIEFSEEIIKVLFDIKNQGKYEKAVENAIRTRAEKYAAMYTVMKLGLNDYAKIRFLENYTGYKMDRFIENEQR